MQAVPAPAESKSPTVHTITTPQMQAMIVGGLGGLLAAGVVLQLIYERSFLVQVASFVGSSSEVVGLLLFYLIGTAVGLLFGLLFDREIDGRVAGQPSSGASTTGSCRGSSPSITSGSASCI